MSDDRTVTALIAYLPAGREQDFLQHIRDFDVANAGCHFQIVMRKESSSVDDVAEVLKVHPEFSVIEVFKKQ